MKRGFTLVEALAVVSIIGLLAVIATYAYTNATSRSRDARRKSDLTAISLGFQSRHDALACSNAAEIGRYPGKDVLDGDHWKQVFELNGMSDGCGAFSEYLITIPADPVNGVGESNYRFDLSDRDGISKHYRLSAILEKTLNNSELADLERTRTIWQDSFGGNLNQLPPSYNYIIGN